MPNLYAIISHLLWKNAYLQRDLETVENVYSKEDSLSRGAPTPGLVGGTGGRTSTEASLPGISPVTAAGTELASGGALHPV